MGVPTKASSSSVSNSSATSKRIASRPAALVTGCGPRRTSVSGDEETDTALGGGF